MVDIEKSYELIENATQNPLYPYSFSSQQAIDISQNGGRSKKS